jgi:HEAT repeat protein
MPPTATTDERQIQAGLRLLEHRLHTLSSHDKEHRIQALAQETLRKAFRKIWSRMDGLPITVSETGLRWEAETVLGAHSDGNKPSLSRILFDSGIRFIALSPGVEETELSTFVSAVHRSRKFTEDDVDDLLTLLWTADFQHIRYKVPDPDRGVTLGPSPVPSPKDLRAAQDVRKQIGEDALRGVDVEQGAASGTAGLVSLEDYESTLYFLDTSEIRYLRAEVEREYEDDLACNVLALLFDTFELQTDGNVRSEVIGVLTDLLPRLIAEGDLGSVVYLLSESRLVLSRAPELSADQRTQLSELTRALSRPEAVTQLLDALDEARVEPTEEELTALFRELSPDALTSVLKWFHRLSDENVRRLLDRAIHGMAERRPDAVRAALEAPERIVILGALRLVAELGLRGMSDPVVRLIQHEDVGVRSALVPALDAVATAGTMGALVTLLRDSDPDVRIASVKALAERCYQGALATVEETVLQRDRDLDLTERRAFFEAYGSLAGEDGVSTLRSLLLGGSFGIGRADSDTRACAAIALGRVGSHSARTILLKAVADRDPVVRTTVSRALQQEDV